MESRDYEKQDNKNNRSWFRRRIFVEIVELAVVSHSCVVVCKGSTESQLQTGEGLNHGMYGKKGINVHAG